MVFRSALSTLGVGLVSDMTFVEECRTYHKTFPTGVLNKKWQNSTILSCIGASAQVYMFTLSEGHTVGNKTHLLWIIHFLFVLYVGLVGSDIMDCCVRLFGCKVIGSLSLRGGNWFFVNVIFAFGYMRF